MRGKVVNERRPRHKQYTKHNSQQQQQQQPLLLPLKHTDYPTKQHCQQASKPVREMRGPQVEFVLIASEIITVVFVYLALIGQFSGGGQDSALVLATSSANNHGQLTNNLTRFRDDERPAAQAADGNYQDQDDAFEHQLNELDNDQTERQQQQQQQSGANVISDQHGAQKWLSSWAPVEPSGGDKKLEHQDADRLGGESNSLEDNRDQLGGPEVDCTRSEYEQFKLALLHEFNGDVDLLFWLLDQDRDGSIGARELWPRPSLAAHSEGQHATGTAAAAAATATTNTNCDSKVRYHHDLNALPARGKTPANHCPDYAFEPHFNWSPCSLSHLIIYELDGASQRLTRQVFRAAFTEAQSHSTKWSSAEPPPSTPNATSQERRPRQELVATISSVVLQMGESKQLDCPAESSDADHSQPCIWTRHGFNLATIRDEHLALGRAPPHGREPDSDGATTRSSSNNNRRSCLGLHLKDAQLYLSGTYKCTRLVGGPDRTDANRRLISHLVDVQVLAKPRVSVRPKFQWSLPNSRVAFECHHDFIDTSLDRTTQPSKQQQQQQQPLNSLDDQSATDSANSNYRLNWLQNNNQIIVDSKAFSSSSSNHELDVQRAPCSSRASTTLASSRLVLERVQANDTAIYHCRVEIRGLDPSNSTGGQAPPTAEGENYGQLLIQDQPPVRVTPESGGPGGGLLAANDQDGTKHLLWSFHEKGVSIYSVLDDEGQELELIRELSGHSEVSGEVGGNWNQLTLCGGLNADQMVICEWSDNALSVQVPIRGAVSLSSSSFSFSSSSSWVQTNDKNTNSNSNNYHRRRLRSSAKQGSKKYIYVGQPNLNRVIVMDGQLLEIVAIINTEPQPRKLFSFKPNKIHLSKWVARRLSPIASVRWLKAIEQQQQQQQQQQHNTKQHQEQVHLQSQAHPLKLTPKSSRLYSDKRRPRPRRPQQQRQGEEEAAEAAEAEEGAEDEEAEEAEELEEVRQDNVRLIRRRLRSASRRRDDDHQQTHRFQAPPKLVQHDIWLLCYGQPLVVDPSSDLSDLPAPPPDEPLEDPAVQQQQQFETTTIRPKDHHHHHHRRRHHLGRRHESASLGIDSPWIDASNSAAAAAATTTTATRPFTPLVAAWPLIGSTHWAVKAATRQPLPPPSQPTRDAASLASLSLGKEARLRNRKSVQIIQSTFLPDLAAQHIHEHHHHHQHHQQISGEDDAQQPAASFSFRPAQSADGGGGQDEIDRTMNGQRNNDKQVRAAREESSRPPSSSSRAVSEFKRLTVVTTHYVIAGRGLVSSSLLEQERHQRRQQQQQQQRGELNTIMMMMTTGFVDPSSTTNSSALGPDPTAGPQQQQQRPTRRVQPQFDLVQDLSVPQRPYSQLDNPRFKLHHAYVTHYDERQLYRISMDGYHYDREIDLQDCDPIGPITMASQGLLIVQCRAPIAHQLIGQLVLDELTSAKIQFNENIRAQESYITPDHRHLISIYTNQSTPTPSMTTSTSSNNNSDNNQPLPHKQSSIIYVQSVRVSGLKFLYEIKTTLEITQCSFVWRDGYYAAIFVALNRRDQQSELLSLRLADSRLELIVRVPGLISSSTRHKEPLNVQPELQIASLSTNQGIYIVDLEENRIIQTLDHHYQQSIPTLLWT